MPSRFEISKTPKDFQRRYSLTVTILFALAALFAIVYLSIIDGDVFLRFGIAIIALIISGHAIANANGIGDSLGMFMLGSKRGINLIESLSSRNQKLWMAFADWGLAFSFGFASYFLFRKYISKKIMAFGILTNVIVLLFVYPYLPVILSFINIPQITSRLPSVAPVQGVSLFSYISTILSNLSNFSPGFYLFSAASIIGGFALSTILLILYSGWNILYSISLFLLSVASSHPNPQILNNTLPGVLPLIPGKTLPLFEGLITLIVLLIVHEFSHGILARIAKVKIKSIGVILFGIIPLGAFVDPDEKQVKKLSQSAQDRISIAGISANMLVSILFFLVTFMMLSVVLPGINTSGVTIVSEVPGYPANGVIPLNATITGWNNQTIKNSFGLGQIEMAYKPSAPVNVITNLGTFTLVPSKQGKLGIETVPAQATTEYQIASFFYAIAALSFGLNFFVAIFNLLPIPAFDGWRIYQGKIKNKKILNAIAAILVAAILVNVLPWIWTIH